MLTENFHGEVDHNDPAQAGGVGDIGSLLPPV